jgi:hypothetical protein
MDGITLAILAYDPDTPIWVTRIKRIVVGKTCVDVWEAGTGQLIIRFCASNELSDFSDNLDVRLVKLDDPYVQTHMSVHRGFLRTLHQVRPQLDTFLQTRDIHRLAVCGFSSGGCVSILYGYLTARRTGGSYPIDVLTAGSPTAMGDIHFNNAVNSLPYYRVRSFVDHRDPVTWSIARVVGFPYVRNTNILSSVQVVGLHSHIPEYVLELMGRHAENTNLSTVYIILRVVLALRVRHRLSLYVPAIRRTYRVQSTEYRLVR